MSDAQVAKLKREAAWVVLLFDQANTNKLIEKLGSRGVLLARGVEDLRRELGGDEECFALARDNGQWAEGCGPEGLPK